MTNRIRLAEVKRVAIAAAALALTGCAAAVPYEPLQATEGRFASARTDPVLQEHAPVVLREAEEELRAAEAARERGEREEMMHRTYMADRRLDLAQAQAERRESRPNE